MTTQFSASLHRLLKQQYWCLLLTCPKTQFPSILTLLRITSTLAPFFSADCAKFFYLLFPNLWVNLCHECSELCVVFLLHCRKRTEGEKFHLSELQERSRTGPASATSVKNMKNCWCLPFLLSLSSSFISQEERNWSEYADLDAKTTRRSS